MWSNLLSCDVRFILWYCYSCLSGNRLCMGLLRYSNLWCNRFFNMLLGLHALSEYDCIPSVLAAAEPPEMLQWLDPVHTANFAVATSISVSNNSNCSFCTPCTLFIEIQPVIYFDPNSVTLNIFTLYHISWFSTSLFGSKPINLSCVCILQMYPSPHQHCFCQT